MKASTISLAFFIDVLFNSSNYTSNSTGHLVILLENKKPSVLTSSGSGISLWAGMLYLLKMISVSFVFVQVINKLVFFGTALIQHIILRQMLSVHIQSQAFTNIMPMVYQNMYKF